MLGFMRRYQRILFIVVTVMIVVSFSFFGTYQSFFQGNNKRDTAFVAVNGKKISHRELAQMILFLGAESDTPWGNPLNDGVLSHDLLESGAAPLLALHFQEALEGELQAKAASEAHYTPYHHPYAPMLGAELIWSSFAPEIKEGVAGLKEPLPFEERFAKRAQLFLAERAFPQSSLKQMIRYQEGQLKGLPQDNELGQRDLSLFGYHSLEDWFGKNFITLTAQLITNGSILAEGRGYRVSKKEAWTDLIHNAEIAALRHPTVYAGSGRDTLETILRRSGMTPPEATQVWQRVLLFRRLLQDAGSAPLIDTLAFDRFSEYAGETAPITYYTLPGRLTLKNSDDLLTFESYLDAVYKRDPSQLATLPTAAKSTDEVKQQAPELVYREQGVRIKEVNREQLATHIPIKEVWNWQLQDGNWDALETRIPTLERQEGERFARLKALDKQSREKADEIARNALLRDHPERVFAALEVAQSREETLKIPYSGTSPLRNVDPKLLMDKLEGAGEPVIVAGDEITYEVTALTEPTEDRIFLFEEAKKAGALRPLADRRIEAGYQARADKTKPLSQVREEMISQLVQSISKQVYSHTQSEEKPDAPTADWAAKMRFVPHMEQIRQDHLGQTLATEGAIHVHTGDPLVTQWEVEHSITTASRSQTIPGHPFEELETGSWSEVHLDPSRGATFYGVGERQKGEFDNPLQYDQIQKALSHEAQKQLLTQLLAEIDARGGIDLVHGEDS